MRSRMPGQHALVQGHARPGDALHERHGRTAVDIRMMEAVLFDDAEDPERRGMSGYAGRDRALRHPSAVAVERDLLGPDIDNDLQRALGHVAEAQFFPGLLFGFTPFTHLADVPYSANVIIAIAGLPSVVTQAARLGGLRKAQ